MDDGETLGAKPSDPASGALSVEMRQSTNRSEITYIVSDSFVTPWTVARQTPLSMGFPRQEYWSRLPVPSPGDIPDPGIKPASPALEGGFFTTEPPGKPSVSMLLLLLLSCFSHV